MKTPKEVSQLSRYKGYIRVKNEFIIYIAICIAASIVSPCDGFFFPKSFFRKGTADESPPPPPPPPYQQQHPRVLPPRGNNGGDFLQGSATDIQSALRIANRPPSQRNNDGPGPGSGFHVPKELCMACERFPWMPVAGAERSPATAASANVGVSHSQQTFNSGSQAPTKTIVINALGEAKGPIPIPPGIPSRRPFAIQFDGNQSGNKVTGSVKSNNNNNEAIQPAINQQINEVQPKPEQRPVTFQIFQAQTPNQQNSNYIQSSVEPIGMQPPPPPSNFKQVYGAPTVLHPAASSSSSASHAPPSVFNVHTPSKQQQQQQQQQQGSIPPPPNPVAVGTIVATQQNNAIIPEFQKIEPAKLVYQEHFTSQYPSPQNFKVPIISPAPHQSNAQPPQHEGGYNSNSIVNSPPIPPQQNFGPPPQNQYRPIPSFFMQMRPPAPYKVQPPPSPNMKPPGVMIHYGKPIRIPTNGGPQRPTGQVHFPPPQAFLQMGPPPPPPILQQAHQQQQQPQQQQVNVNTYGPPRPENNVLDSGSKAQDERRPAPSGQVLNILQPQNAPVKVQGINTNSLQPVPIPVPTLQNANQISNGQNRPTFTQETGWEIIPSIQTDLTHLFSSEQGKQQQAHAGNELPVPVPIPVPQTHPPKAPIFIVAGADQQQNQDQNTQIKVQDVTYHEESRNPVPSDSVRPGQPAKLQQEPQINALNSNEHPQVVQQQQHHQESQQQFLHQGERRPENQQIFHHQQQHQQQENHQPIPQQVPIIQQPIIRPRPFILGVPSGPSRPVIFRPRPQQGFEPLHPSIMTALKHAQHTSLLTHQYLTQSNLGQGVRENSIYVSPVPSTPTTSNALTAGENADQSQVYQGIDPRIPVVRPTVLTDQSSVNCQTTTNQHFIPIQTHQKLQLENSVDTNANNHIPVEDANEASDSQQPTLLSDPISEGEDDNQSLTSDGSRDNYGEDEAPSPAAQSTVNTLKPEPTATSPFQSSTVSIDSSSPGIRGTINVEDNGNKGSYMIYYPRAVSKSPVYWVQPSRTLSQGVVRLSPQITPVSPSVASTVVSWSRPRVVVANQFRTEPYQPDPTPTQEARAEEESYEREESGENSGGNMEHAESGQASDVDLDEQIPYGQKIGVSRDNVNNRTPYDIISVSGSDDEAQSLESDSSVDHSQGIESTEQEGNEHLTGPDFTSPGNDGTSTDSNNNSDRENLETPNGTGSYGEYLKTEDERRVENDENLQDVHEPQTSTSTKDETDDDADDERDDFGFRPQTIFRKPISTTVIHSPGASSFQSLKLPNFKPHRVIVHDFTTHSANAAATGPSGPQGNLDSSESQESPASETVPDSWKVSQKLKAAKLVESESSRDEEGSSESIHRPQGFNIQEVIASGPVSTADCLTTHNGHLLSSHSSTSPRTAESSRVTSGKGRDIYLPLGSRFPGGRPSIFSAVRRPITTTTPGASPTISTTSPSTIFTSSEREPETLFQANDKKQGRDRYFGQSPSGFAASIPVPVYRRPVLSYSSKDSLNSDETRAVGIDSSSSVTTRYVRPQANIILSAEDIYKNSEVKESNRIEDGNGNEPIRTSVESSTLPLSPLLSVETETIDSTDEIMSTEKSSSFSVSVVDDKGGSLGVSSTNEDERAGSVGNNDLQQVNEKPSRANIVHITSVPVATDSSEAITTTSSAADSITSTTTAIPSPASTSTKIVKTVRVRQRMRSGSFNGPLRTRFHGGGKVRVVHRPANQEYIRHFPEFSTQEADKLGKEEEQEVKNALIELKKSPESIKTH